MHYFYTHAPRLPVLLAYNDMHAHDHLIDEPLVMKVKFIVILVRYMRAAYMNIRQ